MIAAVELRRGNSSAEILPAFGGTVRRLSLPPDGNSAAIPVLAGDDDYELVPNPWFRGRILFPFCDRIPDGRFRFDGVDYRLDPTQPDGSAIHGLIWNREGEILTRSPAELSLRWRLGDDPGYPFPVSLTADYALETGGFRIVLTAENNGNSPAPVGFGWHPYFRLPGAAPDELRLTIPAERSVEVEANLMPTGNLPPLESTPAVDFRRPRPVGTAEYDIAFPRLPADPDPATAVLESPGHRILLTASGALAYFQLFTPPDRTSLALEPISNVTDAFNRDDMGAVRLGPGEKLRGEIFLRLEGKIPPSQRR